MQHPQHFLESVPGKDVMKEWNVAFQGTPPVVLNTGALDNSHVDNDCQDHLHLLV